MTSRSPWVEAWALRSRSMDRLILAEGVTSVLERLIGAKILSLLTCIRISCHTNGLIFRKNSVAMTGELYTVLVEAAFLSFFVLCSFVLICERRPLLNSAILAVLGHG